MKIYKTKSFRLEGTDFHEVRKKAFRIYTEIKNKSRRKPYIRSAYFNKENPNKPGEIFHRFTGVTKDNFFFHVHIKENKRSGRKDFISVFPDK